METETTPRREKKGDKSAPHKGDRKKRKGETAIRSRAELHGVGKEYKTQQRMMKEIREKKGTIAISPDIGKKGSRSSNFWEESVVSE